MQRNLKVFTLICITGLFLGACAGSTPTATPAPTFIPVTPMIAASPTPELPKNVSIYYEENAQFELIGSNGRRILIDIANPGLLTSPATDKDILLTTHFHSDHYSKRYVDSFPGQKLTVETGEIQLPDVSIRGIASAHNAADPLQPKDGTNYIYIIDMAGLRIVHFGDIGQETLTPEQLAALGQVDVALTQFENSYSAMDTTNMKGFKLMDQVKPHIVIQTHSSLNASGEAAKKWKAYAAEQPSITLTREQLPAEASIIFMGSRAVSYQKIYKLPWFGKP
jgi:L-ascorbate metabolism protein UlaG (beta-lactamase superfamily)